MTLEEIDNSLPEGLHDAQIRSFVRDIESASLKLLVKVVVGTSQDDKYRLQYRNGEICFHNLQYFVSSFLKSHPHLGIQAVSTLASTEQKTA